MSADDDDDQRTVKDLEESNGDESGKKKSVAASEEDDEDGDASMPPLAVLETEVMRQCAGTKELQQSLNEHSKKLRAAEERERTLDKRLAALSSELNELQRTAADEKESFQETLDDNKRKADVAREQQRAHLARLQALLDSKNERESALRESMLKLQDERDSLQRRLTEAQAHQQKVKLVVKGLRQQQAELLSSSRKANELRAKLQQEVATFRSTHKTTKSKNEDLQRRYRAECERTKRLRGELTATERQLHSTEQRLNAAEKRNKTLEDTNTEHAQLLADMQTRILSVGEKRMNILKRAIDHFQEATETLPSPPPDQPPSKRGMTTRNQAAKQKKK